MDSEEKRVTYQTSNSYSKLGTLSEYDNTLWMVFHGIGYLSRHFIKPFSKLDLNANTVIAPQAPSKYYSDNQYSRVGASWLTKEETQAEIVNVLQYLDAVYYQENMSRYRKFLCLGYSQGVSVMMRWIGLRKIPVDALVIYAGRIPSEMKKEHFSHLDEHTRILSVIGKNDPYVTTNVIEEEKLKIQELFPYQQKSAILFEGSHEIKAAVLHRIDSEL